MKITLKHISDDTGLSISTVSRVLRGEGKTNSQNERLIIESAQRLHYPLQKSKTPINLRNDIYVALITSHHEGEFYSSFFLGLDTASQKTNVRVSLFNFGSVMKSISDFILDLRKEGFDAAVIFLPELNNQDYEELIEKTPLDFPIMSSAIVTNPKLDTIAFDSYGGGHLVGNHFKERGYQKVGLIRGPLWKPEALFRGNGFMDLAHSTPSMELTWTFDGDYSVESGLEAFRAFKQLEPKQRPKAIFASNDAMALGFMESARSEGFSFPEDIAIAGYDNLPMCKHHFPRITSVNTDYAGLGHNLIKQIMARIENPVSHEGILNLIPVTLAVRESS